MGTTLHHVQPATAVYGQVADERSLRLGSPAASPCGANCVLADPFEVALPCHMQALASLRGAKTCDATGTLPLALCSGRLWYSVMPNFLCIREEQCNPVAVNSCCQRSLSLAAECWERTRMCSCSGWTASWPHAQAAAWTS